MKIGIFGGTFDPIHNAHLAVADAARDTYDLDRVLLIPAANPPHKSGASAPFEHRYRMVELAICGHKALEPSLLEAGTARSYSIHTIEKLRGLTNPEDLFYFIIGGDAFAEIRTWHRWKDVVAAVEFVVVSRPGSGYETPSGARLHTLPDVLLPVSSSDIRAALAQKRRPPELPDAVYEYILQNNLYS